MKSALCVFVSTIIFLSLSVHAELGGREEDLAREAREQKMSLNRHPAPGFTVHEMAQAKLTVRQFVDPNGKVFAVAWKGATHPDLQKIMGSSFPAFQKALAQARAHHHGHGPIEIEVDGFHLSMGGQGRALLGRAWLTSQLPTTVNTNDLQ